MHNLRLPAALISLFALPGLLWAEGNNPKGIEFFENKIRPVLSKHCYECHSAQAKKLRAGLLLDSKEGMLKGGDSGPVLVPGKAKESLLVKALLHDGDTKMPPKSPKLDKAIIADFVKWIDMGAPDPREGKVAVKKGIDLDKGRQYWAFRPLTPNLSPPKSEGNKWARTPIDRFILAKLKEKKLTPNAAANRERLIRRAYFDLLGLPPAPGEVEAFVSDQSPDAYEKLIDRLLQSEHVGERWARHWLDLVRYAESGGYEFDKDRPTAYHYRDFVIKAFNQDMPFDQFVRWQIAGDHLAPDNLEAIAATGFLVAGPFPGQTTAKTQQLIRYNHLDDMISTLGSSMLGLSLGCARCHDHKYDPIPQEDYYRLLANLSRTDSADLKVNTDPENYRKAKTAFDAAHAPFLKAKEEFDRTELPKRLQPWKEAFLGASKKELTPAQRDLLLHWLRKADPKLHEVYSAAEKHAKQAPQPKLLSMFAASSKKGGDVYFLIRGEVEKKRELAKPGFMQVLMSHAERDQHWLGKVEPRVALATWITDAEHGGGHLLARVIVNRLWQHHLGRGIVATTNDFGIQGEPPTHPELLDWLAQELIKGGWKLKPIHKLIMTSAVYMQTGVTNPAGMQADPQDHLWWRRPARRLEAEAIRDAVLAVGGTLDAKMYGPGTLDGKNPRRSVYLTVKRSQMVPLMQMFDTPEAMQSIGERSVTTVPTQSLAFMNSPLVRQAAQKFAQRLRGKSMEDAIDLAYLTALSRRPTATERQRMQAFVERQAASYGTTPQAREQALTDCCQVLLCLNEFIFVD